MRPPLLSLRPPLLSLRLLPRPPDPAPRGEPVACGQRLRLEHLTTSRNLHSHHFSSPLSNSQVLQSIRGMER